MKKLKILFVEDVPTDVELALRQLERGGISGEAHRVDTKSEFIRMLDAFDPEIILSDFSLPAFDGMAALEIARQQRPDTPFIFVSGTIGEERAIESLKRGGTDYVLKTNLARLVPVVQRALKEAKGHAARRTAEEEIARQRAFLRQVIDLNPNFIFAKDREGRFVLVNRAVADAYGTTAEQLLGKTDADFNRNPEEVEHFRKIDLEVMDGLRELFIPEEMITDAAGKGRWLQTIKRPIVSANGAADMVLGVATDITERKRSEEALRESEYRLDLALEASDLATWDWNTTTGEVRFSRHWWRILGYQSDEIPLRVEAWEKLTHPDDLVRVKSTLAALFKGSVPVLDVEYRMRAKSGEWRWIRTVGRVVERDPSGHVLRNTGTHGDITERKMQEQRIARLSRIYAVLSGINAAIVRIHDRNELFREVCRIAVEHGQFRMAWIGLPEPDMTKARPVAWMGFDDGYLDAVGLKLKDVAQDNGAGGRALRERRPIVANDIETDPQVVFKKEARARGYRSLVVLPLLVRDEAVGVIALYAAEPGYFDQEEMKLLTELAGDVSFALEVIEKEEKLAYLAFYDALTGLPNSTLFYDRVNQFVHSAKLTAAKMAVLALDIERLGMINDTLGRHVGDMVLKLVADRLAAALDGHSWLARASSNIFAVVLGNVTDEADIAHILGQKVLTSLSPPFAVADQELRLSTKAGVVLFPNDGADAETLFRNAEAALKKAKASGDRYVYYAPEMNARIAEKLNLENKLRIALMDEQFVLHYQPSVDLKTGQISGMEALIRWESPELGLVPPGKFISILEETGMILDVGKWALKRAASDYRKWLEKGLQPPRVAVNVSALQLRQKDFTAVVDEAFRQSDGGPLHLDLEITESVIMENIEHYIPKLQAIRDMGTGIAIDDFGTGYSSLSYLAKLPVTALKIDRAFVESMVANPDSMAIVSTIITLAHSLNLKVIAEGVETNEQSHLLKLLKCDEMQGFLFSRPQPLEQIEALFSRPNPSSQ